MNILIVDDQPDLKVQHALDYLNSKKIKFDYELFLCVNSALRYLDKHLSEVDLAIIDLGLSWFDGGLIRSEIEGLNIITEILKRNLMENLSVPVIINSTTEIEGANGETEEEYFKSFTEEMNQKIEHVDCLEGPWLYEFLQNNIGEKIEFL